MLVVVERRVAPQQDINDDAARPHVHGRAVLLSFEDLRSHIAGRAALRIQGLALYFFRLRSVDGVSPRPRNSLASSDAPRRRGRRRGVVTGGVDGVTGGRKLSRAPSSDARAMPRPRLKQDAGVRTKPKSASLISKSLNGDLSNRFSGLRSRCTMPLWWRYASASSKIRTKPRASISL